MTLRTDRAFGLALDAFIRAGLKEIANGATRAQVSEALAYSLLMVTRMSDAETQDDSFLNAESVLEKCIVALRQEKANGGQDQVT